VRQKQRIGEKKERVGETRENWREREGEMGRK